MIIERTKKEVIFRLSGNFGVDTIQDMANWIEFQELSKKSVAKQGQVDRLVKEIKKGRWSKSKSRLKL